MSAIRTTARLAGTTGLVLTAGVVLAGPASAHVTITPDEGHAGEYTVATVAVPHGCEGSATTKVAIKVPDQLTAITPTVNPGWNVEKTMVELDSPITDAHGNEVTERVDQVVYTAKTPLPDGYRDAFELSFQVPDAAGETLYFPAIQTCVKGETAWVEIAGEGQAEPEHPAPSFTVLRAATVPKAAADAAPGEAHEEDTDVIGFLGLGAGVLGLVLGGTALARTRRRA